MQRQDESWSRAAGFYEKEFVDPYLPGVRNPLHAALRKLARKGAKVVADLGCGIGPLLPFLAEHFGAVHAVDFAAGMLERARQRCPDAAHVHFHQRSLLDLAPLHGKLDVAVTVNSLVMPSVVDQENALREFRRCLKPDGHLLGILPAMDGVHYQAMLLVDRALDRGQPLASARKNAASNNDHSLYDFAFGQFTFQGIEQHFWQPFEIDYRLERTGFRLIRRRKVHLSWKQFMGHDTLKKYPPPWDWFFHAQPAEEGKTSAES
jgi:SAM-dependent methyltransferase